MVPLIVGAVVGFVLLRRWSRSGRRFGLSFCMDLVYLYVRLWHGWTRKERSPLPSSGPAIVVANHTCSADAAFVTAACPHPPCFLIAEEYYGNRLLRAFFNVLEYVPVCRSGGDVSAVRLALRRLREGRLLVIFPEGGLSNAGRLRPRRGKAGVALLALLSGAPVYPIYIQGGPQTNRVLGSWLGWSRVRLIFGPPVDLSRFLDRPRDRRLLEETAQFIMNAVSQLQPSL